MCRQIVGICTGAGLSESKTSIVRVFDSVSSACQSADRPIDLFCRLPLHRYQHAFTGGQEQGSEGI